MGNKGSTLAGMTPSSQGGPMSVTLTPDQTRTLDYLSALASSLIDGRDLVDLSSLLTSRDRCRGSVLLLSQTVARHVDTLRITDPAVPNTMATLLVGDIDGARAASSALKPVVTGDVVDPSARLCGALASFMVRMLLVVLGTTLSIQVSRGHDVSATINPTQEDLRAASQREADYTHAGLSRRVAARFGEQGASLDTLDLNALQATRLFDTAPPEVFGRAFWRVGRSASRLPVKWDRGTSIVFFNDTEGNPPSYVRFALMVPDFEFAMQVVAESRRVGLSKPQDEAAYRDAMVRKRYPELPEMKAAPVAAPSQPAYPYYYPPMMPVAAPPPAAVVAPSPRAAGAAPVVTGFGAPRQAGGAPPPSSQQSPPALAFDLFELLADPSMERKYITTLVVDIKTGLALETNKEVPADMTNEGYKNMVQMLRGERDATSLKGVAFADLLRKTLRVRSEGRLESETTRAVLSPAQDAFTPGGPSPSGPSPGPFSPGYSSPQQGDGGGGSSDWLIRIKDMFQTGMKEEAGPSPAAYRASLLGARLVGGAAAAAVCTDEWAGRSLTDSPAYQVLQALYDDPTQEEGKGHTDERAREVLRSAVRHLRAADPQELPKTGITYDQTVKVEALTLKDLHFTTALQQAPCPASVEEEGQGLTPAQRNALRRGFDNIQRLYEAHRRDCHSLVQGLLTMQQGPEGRRVHFNPALFKANDAFAVLQEQVKRARLLLVTHYAQVEAEYHGALVRAYGEPTTAATSPSSSSPIASPSSSSSSPTASSSSPAKVGGGRGGPRRRAQQTRKRGSKKRVASRRSARATRRH